MLATQRMSSYPGQPNDFPFGYNPENVHGIGLPDFIDPGPPAGQPLLNAHENQDLHAFLGQFDTNDYSNKPGARPQFQDDGLFGQRTDLPPYFVGSETSFGMRPGISPHQLQMGGYMYSDGLAGHSMPQMQHMNSFEHGLHAAVQGMPESSYPNPMIDPLQSGAHPIHSYGPGWHASYSQEMVPQMPNTGRPIVRFGSDSHFQTDRYMPPNGHLEPSQNLDWLEAQSSATNTQPNTQPSSPDWSRKRKLDEYHSDEIRNGVAAGVGNGYHAGVPKFQNPPVAAAASRKRVRPLKKESHVSNLLPTPASNEAFIDQAEEDEEDEQSPPPPSPPAPWPSNKARPPRSTKPPPLPKTPKAKIPKEKKPSTSKSKTSRTSSASLSRTRTPLTADQKKANHTNSEQRRRDATARAYAELYDLVPDLESLGKQSTMKKLEVVVTALKDLKKGNAEALAVLGRKS